MNALHQAQPIVTFGAPLDRARAAMLMLHGRGALAEDILSLARELARDDFAYLAPQAANQTWYPYRFLEPIARNEPWFSSALKVIDDALARVVAAKIPHTRIILLGFSQGACLTLEYVARHARRYGGVAGLTGGLIGSDETPRAYPGSLDGTPIFLGCSDVDFHIPKARVLETERVLNQLGGAVTTRLYPQMGHSVNADEIDFVRAMMDQLK
ncbi:MAG: dienelactone hydrolase family protein [Chloroflexi bacterium]|nr:dienelactone hydrolase family protein [Chloroflexota bacterium]